MKNIILLFLITSINLQLIFAAQSPSNKQEADNMTFDYTKQDDNFWKKYLTGETYKVCRLKDTEKAGSGQYDKFYEKGTYYCACCGGDHALYKSDAKFDSGTGWPSFYAAIDGAVIERQDPDDKLRSVLHIARTEVICSRCHSHLGHVFNDGPAPTNKRYCMNSATLVFTSEGIEPKRTFNIGSEK